MRSDPSGPNARGDKGDPDELNETTYLATHFSEQYIPPRQEARLQLCNERATHICLDCGYIYTVTKPFEEQPDSYKCPQCSAPKKRFAKYDAQTGRIEGGSTPVLTLFALAVGVAAVGALLYQGIQ
ncbi:hypothetical protein CBR_g41690 [Chara braunii]|uniref:Rubredoxin-like domain-containing protein n=1 Tax=Chara braunii TaxID=69332 RepID=A0A388LWC2_CHABU|nr:hypothetical protein CBR_g41690 [Chara braunii]|eukprot:GBG86627.1 hypothetical protein CBR_g41690 [Chara braunii]